MKLISVTMAMAMAMAMAIAVLVVACGQRPEPEGSMMIADDQQYAKLIQALDDKQIKFYEAGSNQPYNQLGQLLVTG